MWSAFIHLCIGKCDIRTIACHELFEQKATGRDIRSSPDLVETCTALHPDEQQKQTDSDSLICPKLHNFEWQSGSFALIFTKKRNNQNLCVLHCTPPTGAVVDEGDPTKENVKHLFVYTVYTLNQQCCCKQIQEETVIWSSRHSNSRFRKCIFWFVDCSWRLSTKPPLHKWRFHRPLFTLI